MYISSPAKVLKKQFVSISMPFYHLMTLINSKWFPIFMTICDLFAFFCPYQKKLTSQATIWPGAAPTHRWPWRPSGTCAPSACSRQPELLHCSFAPSGGETWRAPLCGTGTAVHCQHFWKEPRRLPPRPLSWTSTKAPLHCGWCPIYPPPPVEASSTSSICQAVWKLDSLPSIL